MLVKLVPRAFKQTRWHEYLIRFLLGGLATAATGVIAKFYGPIVGGLFLAFPAIFCASCTLIAKHERERKEQKGLKGAERGRNAAALDAAGTALGSVGLMAFGAIVWADAGQHLLVLPLALAAWAAVSLILWTLGRRV